MLLSTPSLTSITTDTSVEPWRRRSSSVTRAFAAGNEIGTLGDEWTADDPGMRRFHDELLRLRDRAYAHTDRRVGARDIEDVSALLGLGQVAYTEWWRPSTGLRYR